MYRECASVSACWRSSTDRAWSTEDASDRGTEYSNCIVELSPELFRTCQLRKQHTHTSSTPRKPTTGSCFNKCPKQLDKRPHRRALPVLGLPHLIHGSLRQRESVPTDCDQQRHFHYSTRGLHTRTHTHTHTRTHTHLFNGPLSGTTRVSQYQKGKPIWIILKQETMSGSGISWAICKQSAPRSRQITTPAPHYSRFYRPDALPATQPTASKH